MPDPIILAKTTQFIICCQEQAMKLKFVEIGKVMLVWGILKNVTQVMQRVVFLHEDLVKLPSFPRKALEAELDLFTEGQIGKVKMFRMKIFV